MTKQKCAVLTAARMACGHHTAEEILAYAQELLPHISRATVYNNLHALEKEGQIRVLHTDGVADRYDADPSLHGHLICIKCGGISDLFWSELSEHIANYVGQEVHSYELNVRTTCRRCSAGTATEHQ